MAKITAITVQKKDNDRFNLFVDGEFLFGVGVSTVAKNNLYINKDISEDEIEKIRIEDLVDRVYLRVSDYAINSHKTSKDIINYCRELLYKKADDWFPKDLFNELKESLPEQILQKLIDNGIVNDKIYAEMFVEDRLKYRPRSKRMIISELIKKGINVEQAKETVENIEIDERKIIREILMKKYHTDKITRQDNKKISFLAGKGFDWDTISDVLDDE
ncbi:MAG TPA: RecX family transcriptional regulator [Candidatus Dojkabacteria bacterium]|nr:RecX family transcriptional regulator [Candidatus Dojkabacteria bacterium]